jgi:hypothetical protein
VSESAALEIKPLGIHPIGWLAFLVAVLIAFLVFRMLMDRKRASTTVVSGGLVVGVVGRPGSGKTYFASKLALERVRAGAHVITNFSMALPEGCPGRWSQWTSWEDVAMLQDAVVVLDEAHLLAPSVTGFTLPEVARWWLSQVRRFGCDLYWVSQNEMRVSKSLRDLTNYIAVCNSFRGGKSFRVTTYEPEHLRKEGKHLDIKRYRFDPEIGRIFDSWEILGSVATKDSEAERKIRQMADDRNELVRRRRAGEAPSNHDASSQAMVIPGQRHDTARKAVNQQETR